MAGAMVKQGLPPVERFFKSELLPFAEARYSRESGAHFKAHIHQSVSVGAVSEGVVRYRVEEEEALLEPGSLALIDKERLHSCNPVGADVRSYYMLYLDADWCHRVQQSIWKVDCLAGFAKIKLTDEAVYTSYCRMMDTLMDDRVHLLEKEEELLTLITRIFSLACKPLVAQEVHDTDIARLKGILKEDLSKDLSLDSLAARLAANPYTLIRHFKAVTGLTPHAYRMNCRIERARQLLRAGGDIAETALDCGFFDQSHFHRHFKAMTTVTPLQYRRNFIQ